MKIINCRDQLKKVMNLFDTLYNFNAKCSDVYFRYYPIDGEAETKQVVYELFTLIKNVSSSIPKDLRQKIYAEFKDISNMIKRTHLEEIKSYYEEISHKLILGDINSCKCTLDLIDRTLINEKDDIEFIYKYLGYELNQPIEILQSILASNRKVVSYLNDYMTQLELPTKKDWEVNDDA